MAIEEWHFDPSGRFMAEEFEEEFEDFERCGVWHVESGSFLREHVHRGDANGLNPCEAWDTVLSGRSDSSADGKLRASVDGGLELVQIDGETRSIPDCASCGDALAWAPSGYRLATCDGQRLEIWDGSTGKRLRTEALGITDAIDVRLGWTEEGIGAVVRHRITGPCRELESESYCDWELMYDEDGDLEGEQLIDGVALSTFWWPAGGGPAIEKREVHTASSIGDYYTDTGVRWVVVSKADDHDGSSTSVNVFGVGPRTSALGFTEHYIDNPRELWDGRWRVDMSTQWIEGVTVEEAIEFYYGQLLMGWRAIVAEPNPAMYEEWIVGLGGGRVWGEIEVFAALGGEAVTRWEICDGEGCESDGPPEGNCDLLDVSPLLSVAIAHCDSGLRMIEIADGGGSVAKLPYEPTSSWQWGRSNYLALLEPDGHLVVLDGSTGKLLYERDDVRELRKVPLAAEQDRLGLVYDDRTEIIDGPTGKRVVALPGEWLAVALSPDGKQVATLGEQRVEIVEIATGKRIASAPVGDAFGVAWRQDGKALFYGCDWPTHAIDPKTGKLLYEIDDPVFDVFALEDLDPSWRWIRRSDGTVIRTLDFARIELDRNWVRVDSGAFEGELTSLPWDLRFRLGDDPNAPAIYTAAELEPWLRSPGLVEAFFAGKPLPSPRIPVEHMRKLEQRKREG